MKKLLILFALSCVFACKKKTEIYYEEKFASFTYRVESDCDTSSIDSLRYLNEDLQWVKVYDPALPFTYSYQAYGLDSAAMRVFGWAQHEQSLPGRVELSIKYDISKRNPSSYSGKGGAEAEYVYLRMGDSLQFAEEVSYKGEF